MKLRSAQIERKIEVMASSGKVLVQLADHITEALRLLNPAHVLCAVRSGPSAMKGDCGQAALTHGEIEVANRRVVSGSEEELRWLGK